MFEKDKPSGLEEGFHTHRGDLPCFAKCLCLGVKTFSCAFSGNFCLSMEIMALISCVSQFGVNIG